MSLSITEPKRILLIRLKGIGDVILSTPLFRALKKKYPSAQIDLVTRALCEPIVQHNLYLNRVILYPEKPASLGQMTQFVTRLRSEKYDWVVDLAAEPPVCLADLFYRCALEGRLRFSSSAMGF
jgi:ADP-heptose:LPS heptosyltransferase